MRRIVVLLDDWFSNKNFIGSELEIIKKNFDTTVICDYNEKLKMSDFPSDINVLTYKRDKGIQMIFALFRAMTDKKTISEIKSLKGNGFSLQKVSEIIRFYINAELFRKFLVKEQLLTKETDTLFYSYWYFWKCFALSKDKEKYPKINIITRVHGYDLYLDQIPTGYQCFKASMDKSVDKIVFIAEYGMQYYFKTFGIENSSHHILSRLGSKNEYGTGKKSTDGKLRLVSCSSIIELKRIDLIIEALAKIDEIPIEWVHFGSGPLQQEIMAKAQTLLDSKNNIKYTFMGQTPNSEVLKYYYNNPVDAFLMTSRSEGNPVSVMEAMSFGVPIISVNICNMPNMIKGNGILTFDDSPNEIAKAIRQIANASEMEISNYRNKSREIWEEDYQEKKNDEKFVREVLLNI